MRPRSLSYWLSNASTSHSVLQIFFLFLVKGPGTFVPSAAMKVLAQNTNNKLGGDNSIRLCWRWFFCFVLFCCQILEKPVGVFFFFLALIWNRPQNRNFKAKPKIPRSKVAPPFHRDKYRPISWQNNCWNVIIQQKKRDNCCHLSYQKLSSGSFSSRPILVSRVRCHPSSAAHRVRDPFSQVPKRVRICPKASQPNWISKQPVEGLWRSYLSRRHSASQTLHNITDQTFRQQTLCLKKKEKKLVIWITSGD